jgi:4-hydroxy 2-oxovalerate aldolase
MINAKDFISSDSNKSRNIDRYFSEASSSPVGLVRIAAHFKEIDDCEYLVKRLVELGYRVGFNLMQATGKSPDDLARAAQTINGWKMVEVLYFADSFGNMKPTQIQEMAGSLRRGWNGELGVHTHDNMGLALSNSLEAVRNRISWIDSTVLGMGRGAGNTQTEHLLVELSSQGYNRYNAEALFALVLEDFAELKAKYQWGPNLLYYLSAAYNIHPTYVQELLASNNRNSQNVLDSLNYLKSSNLASSYDSKRFARSLAGSSGGAKGGWNAKKLNVKSDVMIVGPGPSARVHQQALNDFAQSQKITVLSTNTTQVIKPELVTAHVACHHTKLMLDYDKYRSLRRPIILPVASMPLRSRSALKDVEVYDYGLLINDESLVPKVHEDYCELKSNLVAGYAMAVALASGAKRILLAGFDGFGVGNGQHNEMQDLFDRFKLSFPDVQFISITPTSYSIKEGSPYAPGISP